jgi:hypothetical protein
LKVKLVSYSQPTANFAALGIEDAQELIFVDLPVVQRVPIACVTRTCTDYDLWHKRLGHPGVSTFERMQK